MSFSDWYERHYRFILVAGSVVILVVGTGAIYLLVTGLKVIAVEFGWPRSVPSTAYAANYIGGALGGVAMGFWLDRSGIGGPAMLGAVMIGLGALLSSQINEAWQLYLIYAVMMGFCGTATLYGPMIANTARWFDRGRGLALGIVAAGQSTAGVIWPPVFRWMIEDRGWRETFLIYGTFALLVMLPVSWIIRRKAPDPAPAADATQAARGQAARGQTRLAPAAGAHPGLSPAALQITLCIAIVGCCISMSMPIAHTVATVTDLGYSFADGAQVLSVILIAATASRAVLIGLLSSQFGGLGALGIFSLVQAIGIFSLSLFHTLPALYVVGIVFGIGYGGLMPCYSLTLREYLPASELGRRTGLLVLFGSFGMATGGWLAGAIFDLTGTYDHAYLAGTLANIGNLAIIGTLILSRRRGHLRPVF
ncbi:MAG: MFS transporter [Alphaproteobacteria bacterium]